jgi:hypothetical protein
MGFPFSTKLRREEDKAAGAVSTCGWHSVGFGKAAQSVLHGGDKQAQWHGWEWCLVLAVFHMGLGSLQNGNEPHCSSGLGPILVHSSFSN